MPPSLAKPKKPKKPKGRPSIAKPGKPQLGPSMTQGPKFVQPTTPAFGSFTPPQTTQSAGQRSTALGTYQAALRTGRQGIVNAALRLGSPEIINALMADPNFAEYVGALQQGSSDPSSLMNISKKEEGEGLEDIDQSSNAGNTYFSGRRLDDRQQLTDDYSNQRLGFMRDYNTNYTDLINMMGTAKSEFDAANFAADQSDYEAFLAGIPKPTGPGAAPATPPPKPGFQFVQTKGTRIGLSYNEKVINGKRYRIYENGDRVRVG